MRKFNSLNGIRADLALGRPFARRMSAVDQCCRYVINLPCDWILVTSMRETRLYHNRGVDIISHAP